MIRSYGRPAKEVRNPDIVHQAILAAQSNRQCHRAALLVHVIERLGVTS
jgi:hypothetical protein